MTNIKDVAKKAGVSIATVSRVLNNRGYISKETRNKVEKAMAEIDYHPNQIARALQKSQSFIIGVIVPDVSHPVFSEMIYYIEKYANEYNYKVMICSSLGETDKETKYISMLRQNRVDGIIACSSTLEIEEELMKANLPIVSFDRIIAANIPYVGSDNFRGGLLASEHLIKSGCKKLLHLSGPLKFDNLPNRRFEAFKLTCIKHNVPFEVIETEPNMVSFSQLQDLIRRKVAGRLSEFDGVFCSNDAVALEIYFYAVKHGLRVPEDLQIVGYDYFSFTRMLQIPRLTTIRQPLDRIGQTLASTLIRMIEGHDPETINNTVVDVELIIGNTTK